MTFVRWTPVFVLPNIDLNVPLGCEMAILVPAKDRRVATLRKAHRNFDRFLGRFSDNFGEKFKPAILLVRTDAPKIFFGVEALASFRNLIAISAIAYSRASHLYRRGSIRVFYGESFAIYPWMLDKSFEDLIGSSPAMLGNHNVAKFKGQSSPSIFRKPLEEYNIDNPLLDMLLFRWANHYRSPSPSWADLALFRSLNMAYHASLMPAGTETTYYDVGRLISLWVSAFEILVHPGGNGQANLAKVFELIERTNWLMDASSVLIHETTGKSGHKVKRTVASFIYDHIYRCRNSFLHGNPVRHGDLELPSGRLLFQYAAPLYRIGLTSFLPLVLEQKTNGMESLSIASRVVKAIDFEGPQKDIEKAILTATTPPEKSR